MIFRKFGGSYQYYVRTPEELPEILTLDPALWAALSVPVTTLNTDKKFLQYLDYDGNGLIRLEDVKTAIRLVQDQLKSLAPLAEKTPELSCSELKDEALAEFVSGMPELAADGKILLAAVGAKLDEVASGTLHGDGVLCEAAVKGSGAETLFAGVTAAAGAAAGITEAQLDKFAADAKEFLDWAKQTEKPQFRGDDPAAYYDALEGLKVKIEEFFRFSELIRLDRANLKRFELDPANLPPLDITDGEAVAKVLTEAPLAKPNAEAVLDLNGELNPVYRDRLVAFGELFRVEKLTPEVWRELVDGLAPYAEYLAHAQGDNIGRLGAAKLEACLAGTQVETLKELFARDGKIGGVLKRLRLLETLILFKEYLLDFTGNFVCFKALFSADETSMIQAGKLIMDGRTFELALWIKGVAEHKAIAVRSHLCLIYLELLDETGGKHYAATAVTAGDLKRIYIGKPAFFIDSTGKEYSGKVVDLVSGPISFWQTLFAPFRKLGEAIGNKVQKLTGNSAENMEKELNKGVDNTAKSLSAPPPPPPQKSSFMSNGSMLLLAGGLSIAALGAALSYMAKTMASIVSSVVAMPPWRLTMWIVIVLAIIFLPLAINALLQLRRRNLTLFLEAAGWAVNLPMRLNAKVSRFFTYTGIYPKDAKFKRLELESRETNGKRGHGRLIALLIVFVALCAVYGFCRYRYPETFRCRKAKCRIGVKCAAKAPAKAAAKPAAPAQAKAPGAK